MPLCSEVLCTQWRSRTIFGFDLPTPTHQLDVCTCFLCRPMLLLGIHALNLILGSIFSATENSPWNCSALLGANFRRQRKPMIKPTPNRTHLDASHYFICRTSGAENRWLRNRGRRREKIFAQISINFLRPATVESRVGCNPNPQRLKIPHVMIMNVNPSVWPSSGCLTSLVFWLKCKWWCIALHGFVEFEIDSCFCHFFRGTLPTKPMRCQHQMRSPQRTTDLLVPAKLHRIAAHWMPSRVRDRPWMRWSGVLQQL